jgi:hypothetical protein
MFNNFGTPLCLKYYNITYPGAGSYYDDDVTLTQSGTDVWTSGIFFCIDTKSEDALLMQQGKLSENDGRFYIPGNLQTSGLIKIGIGSPVPSSEEFSVIQPGTLARRFENNYVCKIIYGRWLPNGSMIGE